MKTLLADGQEWALHPSDCIPHMLEDMPAQSVDFSVFSPPFPAVYAYTSLAEDIGNSEDLRHEAKIHFGFFFRGLRRVLKPGRAVVVHCMQIPRMKRSGETGLFDFRGMLIRLGERAGLVFEYDWLVSKNPQALCHGTPVATPTGWVNIEDINPGDQVIGAEGTPVAVTGKASHGMRPVYRIKFSDNTETVCDGKHLWTIKTQRGVYRTLTTDELIAEGVTVPTSGDERFTIPLMSNPAQLSRKPSESLHPYILGVLIGDGSLGTRGYVEFCSDAEIADRVASMLPSGHRVRRREGTDRANGTVASFAIICDEWHENKVLDALRDQGIHGCRAWEKFIPADYLWADAESRRQLLLGLLDTDGTVKSRSGGAVTYSTVSKRLADDVRQLVESFGGTAKISINMSGDRERPLYCLQVALPKNFGCPFTLERKAERWHPRKKNVCRRIMSIEPAGERECTCITVGAVDGLFAVEGFVLTHNSQAIRTKSRELQFAGLESDRAKCRGALPDYLLKFRAPGENKVAVNSKGQVSRNDWIAWAEACWTDIKETDTFNVQDARGKDDTKHICPLQREVIRRLVLLYSNPGEIVFTPFAGMGSEMRIALKHDRRAYGCEIKPEYQAAARKGCEAECENRVRQELLFSA